MSDASSCEPGHPALTLHGALWVETRPDGATRPHRLPERMFDSLPSEFMHAVVDAAAGVRLRFATAATRIELELAIRPIEFVGIATHPAAIDLLVDGELAESRTVTGGHVIVDHARNSRVELPSTSQTLVFDGLAPNDKHVELWLPHTAIVDVYRLGANGAVRGLEPTSPRWVHHGSSISHGMEATHPTGSWPSVAARALGFDLVDLGFAGSAMLDPFVARAIRDQPADLITLKLGINPVNVDLMKMRAFLPAVDGFLDTIRDGHPTTPLVVISPIICPVVESRPGPMASDPHTGQATSLFAGEDGPEFLTLERIRRALAQLVERRSATDARLAYLDGRSLFDLPDVADGHLPDGLHPSPRGYQLMGERFASAYEQSIEKSLR